MVTFEGRLTSLRSNALMAMVYSSSTLSLDPGTDCRQASTHYLRFQVAKRQLALSEVRYGCVQQCVFVSMRSRVK